MEIVKTFFARYDLINLIASLNHAETYLEIGIYDGSCLNRINIAHKVGVDPKPKNNGSKYCTLFHQMTSDLYFQAFPYAMFDIIFIDGLHKAEQVSRDIKNSLAHLNPGGAIVLHDMNPATIEREAPGINGDCWKAFVELRATATDLLTFTIDNDQGLGVILQDPGAPILLIRAPETYSYIDLSYNRIRFLELVSTENGIARVRKHYT